MAFDKFTFITHLYNLFRIRSIVNHYSITLTRLPSFQKSIVNVLCGWNTKVYRWRCGKNHIDTFALSISIRASIPHIVSFVGFTELLDTKHELNSINTIFVYHTGKCFEFYFKTPQKKGKKNLEYFLICGNKTVKV